MDDHLIKHMAAVLSTSSSSFAGSEAVVPGGTAVPFSPDFFHGIPFPSPSSFPSLSFSSTSSDSSSHQKSSMPDCIPCCITTFVDGGNAELFSAPHASVHFIRIYGSVYRGTTKLQALTIEFFAVLHARQSSAALPPQSSAARSSAPSSSWYDLTLFPHRGLVPPIQLSSIDALDPMLRQGMQRASHGTLGSMIRHEAELHLAAELLRVMGAVDSIPVDAIPRTIPRLLVLDGALQQRYPNDAVLFQKLLSEAAEKNISVAGLSKTCDLLTAAGGSVASTLHAHGPAGAWWYSPVVRDAPIVPRLCFAKLHPASKYVFRVDAADHAAASSAVSASLDTIFSVLSSWSADPLFLGYPYGLVEADQFARVSNEEREYFKTFLFAKLGSAGSTGPAGQSGQEIRSELQRSASAMNAHEVLDRARF